MKKKSLKTSMTMIKKYVDENEARMLEELFSLIRIPSVSAQPPIRKIWYAVLKDGKNCF